MYSILTALGVKHVDYFSLDIEGPEVEVLKTLPLRKEYSTEKSIPLRKEYGMMSTPLNKRSKI
ncbi:hypothetical protein LSH36_207g03043 [Paralvinella palmiformis]|uniref:Methyltransferase FkbM domain-containing protein n=1 Tax=Paralvinella palmiformis TaxID=53620 RepID=A0AAD9JP67_9ANNE|nr:hypothetical protein LSH36_207g03043 [Paralvinella palmiformis]